MVQAAMRRYNGITNKEDRGMGMTKEEILVHVDHTLLKAVSAWDEIQTLCEEAIENHTEEEGVAIMAEHIEYQMLEILKSLKK